MNWPTGRQPAAGRLRSAGNRLSRKSAEFQGKDRGISADQDSEETQRSINVFLSVGSVGKSHGSRRKMAFYSLSPTYVFLCLYLGYVPEQTFSELMNSLLSQKDSTPFYSHITAPLPTGWAKILYLSYHNIVGQQNTALLIHWTNSSTHSTVTFCSHSEP